MESNKIFFTDLDGTLLNDAKEISPATMQAVQEMLTRGHAVVISTGRALPSAVWQAQRLGLTHRNCYIICYNGGQIYDISEQKILYAESVPFDLVRFCFDRGKEDGIHVQTYSRTEVLTELENPELGKYCKIQNLPGRVVSDVIRELSEEPAKVLAIDQDPEKLDRFRHRISDLVGDRLSLFLSHSSYLEMVPPGVNKGNAVRFLCDYLHIPVSDSVAAGDAENDLTMIKAAGIGAAMCNGDDIVRSQADYVTEKDNNHDGIVEIIEKFIL